MYVLVFPRIPSLRHVQHLDLHNSYQKKGMLNVSRNEALKLVLNFISKLTQIKYNVKV